MRILSQKIQNYWSDIDVYFGGSEHATGHLLYSRFYQKFLYDLNLLNKDEYAKKLSKSGNDSWKLSFYLSVNQELQNIYQKV